MKKDEVREGKYVNQRDRLLWSFFLDEAGCIAFNKKCSRCIHSCKQSFRMILIHCPKYRRGHMARESSGEQRRRRKGGERG